MSDFPVTVADDDGDEITVHPVGDTGLVFIVTGENGVTLNTEQQEAFGQGYIAACNAADRQNGASHAWPIAPYARDDEQVCSAETQASPEEGDIWYCTAAAGHEPMQHGAYRASGDLVAHWPVTDD